MSSTHLQPEYDQVNALYKLEENGYRYYLPSKSLHALETFFDSFIPTSKIPKPTIISWYNSLSRSEQADILIVTKRR